MEAGLRPLNDAEIMMLAKVSVQIRLMCVHLDCPVVGNAASCTGKPLTAAQKCEALSLNVHHRHIMRGGLNHLR